MRATLTVVFLLLATAPLRPADTLYGQAVAKILNRLFPASKVSYLLLDTRTGELMASRWPDRERPVPLGSLVKPFTALAYASAHGFRYPEYVCRGKADGCWLPTGHGRVDMTQAIAHSCNAYFHALAGQLPTEQVTAMAQRFGIVSLPKPGSPTALVGLGSEWKVGPLAMARAYSWLAQHSTEPGAGPLLRGMALSGQVGTGRKVGSALQQADALVKTGTAPCTHGVGWSSDGYVIMLYPADSPRLTLLVQVHGVPGAVAADTGGRMLRAAVERPESQ